MVSGKPICRKLFGWPEHTFFHFLYIIFLHKFKYFFWLKTSPHKPEPGQVHPKCKVSQATKRGKQNLSRTF